MHDHEAAHPARRDHDVRGLRRHADGERKIEKELLAIDRFIKAYRDLNYLAMGAFIDLKLVGFCFFEVLNNNFADFHLQQIHERAFSLDLFVE